MLNQISETEAEADAKENKHALSVNFLLKIAGKSQCIGGGRSRKGAAKCLWLSGLWGGGQLLMPDYTKMPSVWSHLPLKHIWTG
jgi:hypothetical protein